jgi:predicted nicotinamide N-methyase
LQLWKGTFLLADYILHHRNDLAGHLVVELGCGVGFSGLALQHANISDFLLTDMHVDSLGLAAENLLMNSLSTNIVEAASKLRVLDWFYGDDDLLDNQSENPSIRNYGIREWSMSDTARCENPHTVFIAADVIYDNVITEAFFVRLSSLMRPYQKLIMTLEKRFNISWQTNDVAATGYQLFRQIVGGDEASAERLTHNQYAVNSFIKKFSSKKLKLSDLPQHVLDYERTPQMELWEITCLT